MYKLTVVAGPNRGTTFALNGGETSIGRQAGNLIILSSAKVSKRHCSLVVDNEEVVVKDLGSSNGTFVNGVLTKLRKVASGDRISVGDYVLELSKPQTRVSKPVPIGALGQVVQFPSGAPMSGMAGAGAGGGDPLAQSATAPAGPPKDLKGRLLWLFENRLMPIFYGLNLKHEWRLMGIGLFAAFIFGNLVISVYPLLESGRATIVKETGRRARFMAKEIIDRNSAVIAARMETKSEIGNIDREDGVRVAVLTDLDNRILAPPSKLNQYLIGGSEASVAIKAKNMFLAGRESGLWIEADATTVVAVEPMKVLNAQLGKNVVVGMAVVSIDTTLSTPDFGEMSVVYSETLILTGLLGGLILLILYRVTLKPFEVLNEDIDKVLKGDMSQVTHEFRFGELNQLWDVLNSALQRVPKAGSGSDGMGAVSSVTVDDFVGPLRALANFSKYGFMILDGDKKIVFINSMFEEIAGLRSDASIGQDIPAVARDQAFGPFSEDLFARCSPGSEGASEDFDFSGVSYKMYAASFGASGSPKCYFLAAVKNENG